MATIESPPAIEQPSQPLGRHSSPPPNGLRQRPQGKTTTFAENTTPLRRRRSSLFSDSLSDSRRSFRASTDDLLLPRLKEGEHAERPSEPSHWHSLPLALALVPAVAGLFIKDGTAIFNDLALLSIAAIFMNWALRLPWEWYHSAQAAVIEDSDPIGDIHPIEEDPAEDDDKDIDQDSSPESLRAKAEVSTKKPSSDHPGSSAARRELRVHEAMALMACFVSPALAAWLLHALRAQLKTQTEGLVSNYNLTIFLMVAEIRPLSHLWNLMQKRTLFLQRLVSAEEARNLSPVAQPNLDEVFSRIEDIERSVLQKKDLQVHSGTEQSEEVVASKAAAHASSEIRKTVQPELDALNRAMRRYEKRTTISAMQIEARLQELEARIKDVVVLAAAAQRQSDSQPRGYSTILFNWASAIVVLPVEYVVLLLKAPFQVGRYMISPMERLIFGSWSSSTSKDGKLVSKSSTAKSREKEKRPKASN